MSEIEQNPIHPCRRFGPVLEDWLRACAPRPGECMAALAMARPGGQEVPGCG